MKKPNNYLSVLYKHIIQVENKNVGLKVCVCVCVCVGGAQTYHCPPPIKKVGRGGGGHLPPPASYASDISCGLHTGLVTFQIVLIVYTYMSLRKTGVCFNLFTLEDC